MEQYRALGSSILYLVINIIGLGLGPLAVGSISDALAPSLGIESIRWAIMSTSIVAIIGGGMFFLAGRHVREDLRTGI